MSIRSMTGFARVRKTVAQGEVMVSLKSVNHRGLDLHFHMSPELDALENDIRSAIKSRVARGHFQIHVSLTRTAAVAGALNRELLEVYMRAFQEASRRHQLTGQPDLNAALRIPGMLSTGVEEELGADLGRAVMDAVVEAAGMLNAFREREGAALTDEIRQRCRNIGVLVSRLAEIRDGAVPAFQKRLKDKLADLLEGVSVVDPQRIAQEAALLADRSDISEELVRLRTHAAQLEAMLASGGEVGKRLDFLLQEMNREANTVLSKTSGLGEIGLTITDLGLAVKTEIDKIREQSLNLE